VRYGWDWYGWMSGWNSAGGHENEASMFMPYVLWGDWRRFEDAEIKTLWGELSPVMMFDQPIDMPNHWHYLYAWPNYSSTGVTQLTHPAYYNRAVWGRPDSGHCGMWQQMEYYYLTGDRTWLDRIARPLRLAFRAHTWPIGWVHAMYALEVAFAQGILSDDDVQV
jgi:hypothetical protein